MKQTKIGRSQINNPTPKWVIMLAKMIKRSCKVIGGTSMMTDHPYIALACMIVDGLVDEFHVYIGETDTFKDTAV